MTQVADGAEMEHRRTPRVAHPRGELPRRFQKACRIVALRACVPEAGAAPERLGHPAGGRRNADPKPVVLTHKEQRDRQPLVRGVRRGVQRGLRGRVIQRSVSKAAHGDGVARPGALHPEFPSPVDRDSHSDRPRKVRGDGRRLWDHGQIVVAEHLVPAAGDRLVGRGGDTEHHVGHAVAADLTGAGEVERAGSVVEQGRVGRAQGERDRSVALVSRRADRVEAAAFFLQPARCEIAVAARDLGAPERLSVRGR